MAEAEIVSIERQRPSMASDTAETAVIVVKWDDGSEFILWKDGLGGETATYELGRVLQLPDLLKSLATQEAALNLKVDVEKSTIRHDHICVLVPA